MSLALRHGLNEQVSFIGLSVISFKPDIQCVLVNFTLKEQEKLDIALCSAALCCSYLSSSLFRFHWTAI